jgi:hypothetical protein
VEPDVGALLLRRRRTSLRTMRRKLSHCLPRSGGICTPTAGRPTQHAARSTQHTTRSRPLAARIRSNSPTQPLTTVHCTGQASVIRPPLFLPIAAAAWGHSFGLPRCPVCDWPRGPSSPALVKQRDGPSQASRPSRTRHRSHTSNSSALPSPLSILHSSPLDAIARPILATQVRCALSLLTPSSIAPSKLSPGDPPAPCV